MSMLALLLVPVLAQATAAEPVCIRAGDVPPAFTGWYGEPVATPGVGKPFVLTTTSDAAGATFRVTRPGTYRVALGEGAWIDLLSRGRALTSTGHGHGPICTGMRKIVDFKLTRGSYQLRLTKLKAPTVKVMIARGA